jgi:hypothetical protein
VQHIRCLTWSSERKNYSLLICIRLNARCSIEVCDADHLVDRISRSWLSLYSSYTKPAVHVVCNTITSIHVKCEPRGQRRTRGQNCNRLVCFSIPNSLIWNASTFGRWRCHARLMWNSSNETAKHARGFFVGSN